MKKIVNVASGQILERDLTSEEVSDLEKIKAEHLEAEQAEAEKQAKKESAKAKLTALGLDEAEVRAILGL